MRPVAIAVSMTLLLACGSTERPPSRSDCAGVCGSVVDASTGKPIREFTLALFSADARDGRPMIQLPAGYPQMPGPLITTTTIRSEDGWFDVSPGAAASVIVGVSARAYRRQETKAFAPDAKPLNVALAKAPHLRIRVSDEARRPVPAAALFYDSPTRTLTGTIRSSRSSPPLAETDDEGVAVLDEPELPSLSLIILKNGFVAQRITVARGLASAEATLRSGKTLRGVARLASGGVAPGAAIEARCDDYDLLQTLARTDGSFVFTGLPAARCEVVAARELEDGAGEVVLDSVRGSTVADLRSGSASVDVVIPPSARVSGKLTGLDRIDEGYAAIARRGDETVPLRTSADGSFSGRLPPGTWSLLGSFHEDGTYLETPAARLRLGDGELRRVDLAFGNTTAIEIRVEGEPLSAPLTIEPRDGAVATHARMNPQRPGIWQISGLAPGPYVARFNYWQWDVAAEITVPSQRKIALRRHQIALDLRDPEGREVSAQVEVTRRPPTERGIEITGSRGSAQLAGNTGGRYVGWELVPGPYEVAIRAAGYRDANATIVIPGEPLAITLQTIDRPYARPAVVPSLDDAGVAVLRTVVGDLQRFTRERWRQTGDPLPGRLVVVDETLRRPPLSMITADDDALERLQALPLFTAFTGAEVMHRLPHRAFPDVLEVRLADVPTVHPNAWDQVRTEFAMFDPYAAALRWDRAAGVVLLSSPELSATNDEAIAFAKLLIRGTTLERVYRLRMRDGAWRIVETIDVSTEEAC